MDTPLPNFFERFVGQPWDKVGPEVVSLPHDLLRVLDHNSFTTADYIPTRITIWLNEDQTVGSIGYG